MYVFCWSQPKKKIEHKEINAERTKSEQDIIFIYESLIILLRKIDKKKLKSGKKIAKRNKPLSLHSTNYINTD